MSRAKSNNSKQANSSYQSLYLWASFLLGMISLGIVIWNRRSAPLMQSEIQKNTGVKNIAGFYESAWVEPASIPSQGNYVITSLLLGTLTYQVSGSPLLGALTYLPSLQAVDTRSSGAESKTFFKTWGGLDDDLDPYIEPLDDGGFMVYGITKSFGAGAEDILLSRWDSAGNALWVKSFGGNNLCTGQFFTH